LRPLRFFGQRRSVRIWNDEKAPKFTKSKPLKVVVWNIQYGAGIRQHFFYDGGRAVSTPKEEVEMTVKEIGEFIKSTQADVVMLQEVDRRARRTAYLDEFKLLSEILASAGLTCRSCASYWRVPYVPTPKWEHLGRVGMHLVTFSRYRISSATRWQLPLLKESKIRQLFNLRRCALDTVLEDSDDFALINTHLSAFSRGDGTLEKQVDTLLTKVLIGKKSWLLAGDFNSLAPWQSPNDLSDEEAAYYPQGQSPVAPLYANYNAAFSTLREKNIQVPFTYKPYSASAPECTIDHAFTSDNIQFSRVKVLPPTQEGRYLSDHQPLEFTLSFSSS